jgi:ATP-dependent DNA ligase
MAGRIRGCPGRAWTPGHVDPKVGVVLLDGPIAPMLCTPGRALPGGEGRVLEPKWDGIRAVAHVTADGPRLFTRHGRGHHDRFSRLNAELTQLPVGTVLDGELACLQPLAGGRVRCRSDRVSAFMVSRIPHRRDADGLTATLIAFDALAVAGADLRAAPGTSGARNWKRSSTAPPARCA